MIQNTTADMNDPSTGDRGLLLVTGLPTGSPSGFIEAQEKAGQSQLVHSDRLPTEVLHGTDAEFEALGFTFGEPDASDPLFRPATLPDGWSKQASDHDMWSYIVDPLGRRRVGVFYKAAFYDRKAHMAVKTISGYVTSCQHSGTEIISDDTWATPAEIVAAAQQEIARSDKSIAIYSKPGHHENAAEWIAEEQARRAVYQAIADRFDTTTSNDTTGATA